MKIILSHPTGNNNVRAIALALVKSDLLQSFYTTVATFPEAKNKALLNSGMFKEAHRRSFDPLIKTYTHTYPWFELGRLLSSKFGWKKMNRHEQGMFCIDAVYKSLDLHVAKRLPKEIGNGANAIYAYEDGALESFIQAKKLGMKCIYDLPIAYYETARSLMQEEAQRLPQWAETLGGGISDSEAKLARKKEELELADVVVGPSSFVINSLPNWATGKIQITAAFGSPEVVASAVTKKINETSILRVLFVGSMGQRKGLGDLAAAFKMLNSKNIELIILGSMLAPPEFYKKELPDFTYISCREHSQVLALMRTCDVFCLPSIVEGRALVMQEAMSQGLPLIITPNTGGADLIEDAKTGFLVPIRSPAAIAEKLEWFLLNRSKIPEMAKRCREVAKKVSWEKYGETIIEELKESIACHVEE